MNSTYKLIGVFWDGKPTADLPQEARPYNPEFIEAGSPPCLFDLIEKKRFVMLSRLLNIDGQEGFNALMNDLTGCRSIAILIDYWPQAHSKTHERFFLRRTSQAVFALSSHLPGAEITLMSFPESKLAA